MEPEGPLTPGSSYGPPPIASAAQGFLSCTLQSSCPPNVTDVSAKSPWGHAGDDEASMQSEGAQPSADLGKDAQRRFRSSAFPSSLSWDSDSEKETLDEEELQHFSNPHGLAAHSPGSPSAGLRPDNEDDPESEKMQHSHSKMNPCPPEEGHDDNNESAAAEESNAAQPGQPELAESKIWSVSEGAELFLSKIKPKGGCQAEEEEAGSSEGNEEEKRPRGKETKEAERDVYTFPGDSDPESPPPAPWAHCTFIQRCRKKRVLLRPFSGLGTLNCTKPETGVTLQKSRSSTEDGGVYDFDDVGFGEGAAEEELIEFSETVDKEEESEAESERDIFTCVECSIYFNKQIHLQEHMVEHCQSGSAGGRRFGKVGRFQCVECGWNLPSRLSLAEHHKRHEESRLKILGEIEKLNGNGKTRDTQKVDGDAVKDFSTDSALMQDSCLVLNPGKVSEPEIITSPPQSPAHVSTPKAEQEVIDVDAAPSNSARPPAPGRAVSYRRRFACTKCNFNGRTSQALANHSKTHNRKKNTAQADSPYPGSPSCLTPTSLACAHCAFHTSSETVLREHQKRTHPGSTGGVSADESGQCSKSNVIAGGSKPLLNSDHLPESGSLPGAAQGLTRQGIAVPEDGAESERAATRPASLAAFTCTGNRRFSRRGKAWTGVTKREDEEQDDCGGSTEFDSEHSQSEASSPVGVKRYARARSNTDVQSPTLSKSVKDEGKQGVQKGGKVLILRRSARVTATPAETDSDGDDDDDDDDGVDEERVRAFLSEAILDEENDESDEQEKALRSVERKCPYCPDRFHNGIGLANHVRGHLNRVGVSYNVRHFISPEEVNAIERKFSYQKKKKKVANFDPDTFSVMHCEFCSAGFDTRAGLSSHARAHLRDFGITNWDVTISPIHILRELFSSRPDLVIPTAPPRSLSSPQGEEEEDDDEEDEEEEEEEEGITQVKLEAETSESLLSDADPDAVPLVSPQPWKKAEKCEGDEEEAAEEEDEQELQLPGGLSSSLRKTAPCGVETDGLSPEEDADTKVHNLKCEVCGAQFGTRRGLSSHARSHLRQLGISVSESSGAPIKLLYQIAKERNIDGQITSSALEPLSAKSHDDAPVPRKDEDLEDMDEKPIALAILAKAVKAVAPASSSTPTPSSPDASPAPRRSGSPPSVVRKAPISSLLPASSPLRSLEHKAGGMKGIASNLSGSAAMTTAKPLWAPQENDAPLNLTLEVDPNKDIVCQLCGAWFETRKGLSSHARAHLRHFGVEYSESKGSPIDLLNQLIDTDDFKHKATALQLDGDTERRGLAAAAAVSSSRKQPLLSLSSSSPSSLLYKVTAAGGGSTSKATSASSLLGPPAKRLKSSSMQLFRLSSGELMALPHSEPPKEIGCEYCGEYFENRKGLSSHARSHLRQMGITEWSVNGSPIDTLREVIARRGLPCALPLKPRKTPPPSSPVPPPRSPLSASSSPSATLLGRLPFAFARPSSPAPPPPPPPSKSSSAPPTPSGGLILKLKPEPMQLEVTTPGAVGRSASFSAEPLGCRWSDADSAFPLNLALAHEVEPTRDIRCEFCGEYFENRKGLSSHARSHLRQMGITEWTVNGSPIDTLREVMHKRGVSASSDQGVKKESIQGANSPRWETTGGAGGSEGLVVSGYQSSSSKFRKSPLSLLQSGSRLHRQSLASAGQSSTSPAGKLFRMTSLGKRPLSEEALSAEASHSPSHQLKTFSPLPRDFTYKRKPSPDKHAHRDPSCELCGFYFENRKALASHARAHLRQFGVTEWCVNGSPIETLSAWIRSRPQKVLEMHRSYMQGSRSALKKKTSSSSSSSSSSSQWSSSLAVSLVQPPSRDLSYGSSKIAEGTESGTDLRAAARSAHGSPSPSRLACGLPLQAQVARSELNVRLPRGFERRPLKHPSCPDGMERDSGPPKPPRTGTVPALVPKPPSYPLVKLVGKFYTLKCRFCEVEFHGPMSVQEDWIRHLQQHILKMNYNKAAPPKADSTQLPPAPTDEPTSVQASAPASTSTSSTTPSTTLALASAPTPRTNSRCPTPVAECARTTTATEIVKVSEEQPTLTATPVPLPPAQVV